MTWPIVKLGDICEIYAGGGAPQLEGDFCVDGIPFIRAGSLPKLLNGIQECQLEKINALTANQYRLKLYNKDAIVFAKSGMSATKGHIYRLKNSCYIVNHLAILKPLDACFPSYLEHALKKYSPTSLILDPAYPSIRLSDISSFKLPLPPLAEQQRIAEILDKAELVKRKRELAIEKLNDLAQSLFVEMFGDFSKKSQLHKLEEFNNLINETKLGLVRGTSELNDFNGYPYLRMNAITSNGELQFNKLMFTNASDIEVKEYTLKKHDFLFNTRNSKELVGKTAIFLNEDNNYLFNNNIMRIRFNQNANPSYIAHAFKTQYVQNQLENIKSGTTNVFAIYFKDLKNIKIPIPNIVDQNTFALKIEALHLLKNKFKESVNAMKVFNASLQNQAFKVGFDA